MNAGAIYFSRVMHARHFPMRYHFDYPVFSFLLDIDRIAELTAESRWFSHNRFNLFSVYDRNHGARDGTTWREWLNPLLDQHDLSAAKHKVYLLCFPRVLAYTFNPLSLWFCYNAEEQLCAVIAEVSNTVGEHHHYILHQHNQALDLPVKASCDKAFYVSPFINMQQRYHFTIDAPNEHLSIRIDEHEQQNTQLRPLLIATQHGERAAFTNKQLWRCFWQMPFMTLKVMVMIHWHALKIWRAGGKYHARRHAASPDKSHTTVTTHSHSNNTAHAPRI